MSLHIVVAVRVIIHVYTSGTFRVFSSKQFDAL